MYGESGDVECFCCVKRDVGDRIRAEAALEESRRTHAAVLEAALDCFISIDADGEERAQFPLGDPHTAHPLGDGVVLATEGTALTWWCPGRAPVPLEHDFEVVTTSALPDGVVAWSDTALYEWRSPRP